MSILKPVCPHCGYVPDEEFGHTIGTEVMCPQCRSNFTIEDPEKAKDLVENMCKKLLANLVIENYKIIGTQ